MRGTRLKHNHLVSITVLGALLFCGCAQSLNVQSDPSAEISVSGIAQAPHPLAPVENSSGADDRFAAAVEMRFGVAAERKPLEAVSRPLSLVD